MISNQVQIPPALILKSGPLLSEALRGYGHYLHDMQQPLYLYVHAVVGVIFFHPELRPFTHASWKIIKQWQYEEPGKSRVALPRAVVRAILTLALLWGWVEFAALVGLAFGGMLRPSDFQKAPRSHLVLPRDRLEAGGPAFFYIPDAKTSRRFSRRQHARIDDPSIVQLLDKVFGALHPTCPLSRYTVGTFKSRWNCILSFFGLPHSRAADGATPGCLRGSGATDFYIHTEDIPRTMWRGRWRGAQTLEYYLQETAAQMFLSFLSDEQRQKLCLFADASGGIVRLFHSVESKAQWSSLLGHPTKSVRGPTTVWSSAK